MYLTVSSVIGGATDLFQDLSRGPSLADDALDPSLHGLESTLRQALVDPLTGLYAHDLEEIINGGPWNHTRDLVHFC